MTNWLEFFDENLDGLVNVQKDVPQAWKKEYRALVKEGRGIRDAIDEGKCSSSRVEKWFRETESFAHALEKVHGRARAPGPPTRSHAPFVYGVDDMGRQLAQTALGLAALVAARYIARD